MSERLKAIRRIQAVQTTVRDLAAWRLGVAQRQQADLEAARTALDAFVVGEVPTGALASLAGATVRRLAARQDEADTRRGRLEAITRAAETRLRLADKLVDDVGRAERDTEERQRLEALMDMLLAQGQRGDRSGL